ncbi:unnamed protein product [Ambrosiozyma monospora]|uniref:Unnamed protein product n=1 Tax=Ambrosiozyma monospora TaxID=43982 RepID=A0ACB5T4M2_AMBMO|nr:unnamed protein product [Ambrosiozyma monospora]
MTISTTETLQPGRFDTTHSEFAAQLPKQKQHIKEVGDKFESRDYQDWRQQLKEEGFVVVKNVLNQEKAQHYRNEILNWLTSFGTPLKIEDKSTWHNKNLPVHGLHNVHALYSVSHEKFVWDLRSEPKIRDAFGKVWGTDELLVSFDGLNIGLPGLQDDTDIEQARAKPWQHVDQSPFKQSFQCVQGIAQLSKGGPKDGGLVVYPKSHKHFTEFTETQLDKSKWVRKDWLSLSKEHVKWYEEVKGIKPYKVIAEPGDLILWDSRTIHYAVLAESDEIRTIAYVSYSPASFATPDALEKKKEAFEKWLGTTHWAHDNINPRNTDPVLANGEVDPRNRKEPIQKPELNDIVLKLAGVKPY